jgi:hypothetical protein
VLIPKDLYKQVHANQWLDPPRDEDGNPVSEFAATRGVVIQREDGSYVTYPHTLNDEIVKATLDLNVPIAFSMSSEVTAALLSQISPEQTQLGDPRTGIMLPIIESVEQIASGEAPVTRDQFICLCKHEQFVLVWGDTVENIVTQGADIETWLVGLVSSPTALSPRKIYTASVQCIVVFITKLTYHRCGAHKSNRRAWHHQGTVVPSVSRPWQA